MMHLNASRAALRGILAMAGALAALALLAGCFGGDSSRGTGRIQINLAPIVQQLGGSSTQTTQSSGTHSTLLAGPPASTAVTPVQTLVVGAIVIDFQDTPIGPDTPITDTVKNSLKDAAINSVQFLSLVGLPTSSDTAEFDAPPPGATHWQIVVVGMRDSITSFDQIGDNSPIYYGFNADANGVPFFLSSATVGSQPIDIQIHRACLVKSPPAGCAQFQTDRTFLATPAVEIVGVYLNGSITNSLTGAGVQNVFDSASATSAEGVITPLLSAATSVRVDTTHKNSAAYGGTCTPQIGPSPGVNGNGTCTVESYITNY